jgi:carbonic anhydrase
LGGRFGFEPPEFSTFLFAEVLKTSARSTVNHPSETEDTMIPAREALERLRAGNQRFVNGTRDLHQLSDEARRSAVAGGQEPFAVILGCADSRVPAEIVFDQGLGDLFVIRVAGNVVAPSLIGSVEFAAEQLGTRLVVVLGHTNCGAVTATVAELENPSQGNSSNLNSIVARIRPAVQTLFDTDLRNDRDALLHHAIRANVRISAQNLRASSQSLENLMENDGLLVVGAEYSLETGVVDFFDVPEG